MAKIIQFEQTAAQYRQMSVQQAERGDRLKALLYARKSAEKGGIASQIRLADALYESGNFEQAADIFLALYFGGERSRDVYSGLTRCFFDMSRLHAAEYFMQEGVNSGALGEYEFTRDGKNIADLIPPLVFEYPFRSYAVSAARFIYPVKKMLTRGISSFLSDASIDDSISKYRCGEILEDAFAIVISVNLDKRNATKMLDVCKMTLERDPDNIGAIAAQVQALAALGRTQEAADAADEIRMFDMSGDIVELIKCAFAFASVGDHEGVVDYAEEVLTFCEEESALLYCAFANINVGDFQRAKELFSYVLRLSPKHPIAHYYARLLESGADIPVIKYTLELPEDENARRRKEIEKIFEQAYYKEYTGNGEELFEWALTCDTFYVTEVGREMIKTGLYPEIIRAALMSCTAGQDIKRKLLAELLNMNHKAAYDIFVGRPVRVKARQFGFVCGDKAKKVYFAALAALSVYYDSDGEKKLAKNFAQALPVIENDEFYMSIDVLAAAVLLHCKFRGMSKSEHIAGIFGKPMAEIVAAEKILFAAEKA